jgi:hypothetical protein
VNRSKLQAWASLAEVVSALAIIVSLLYVGSEFRRTNTMSSREADVALYERLQDANRMLVETPGLAETLVAWETSPEDLSEADRRRLLAFQQNFFETWELGWYYHDDGILDESSWTEWDRWFASEAQRRPVSAWTEVRDRFASEFFRNHVDSALTID